MDVAWCDLAEIVQSIAIRGAQREAYGWQWKVEVVLDSVPGHTGQIEPAFRCYRGCYISVIQDLTRDPTRLNDQKPRCCLLVGCCTDQYNF